MIDAERVTGTPNEQYDLISVLYHALQGGETSELYINDARKAVTKSSSPSSSRFNGKIVTGRNVESSSSSPGRRRWFTNLK